jgi:uncharacterized membrane protein
MNIINKKILSLILLPILALPSVAFASTNWFVSIILGDPIPEGSGYGMTGGYYFTDIITKILNSLWILFTAIAVIMFVIAGITFLTANGEPEKLKLARSALIGGTVGVIVGIIAYSIITIVESFII